MFSSADNDPSMTWSPFTCLPKAALTPSGLLQLDVQDHEVELIRRGPLELRYDGSVEPMAPCPSEVQRGVWQSRSSDLTLTVTTHRLVFWFYHHQTSNSKNNNNNNSNAPSIPMARFLHLSNLQQTEPTGGPSLLHPNASYKLILSTYTYGDLVLSFKATNNSNHNNGGGSGNASQDRDAIEQQINKALERKAWEMATRLQQKQLADTNNNSIMTKRRVGVDHILTKNKLKHQQAQRLAEEALSGDAELLLREAGALLQVIQKYTTLLQKNKESSSSSTTTSTLGDEEDEDAQRLSIMLQDMGMTSALTKDQISGQSRGRGGGPGRRRRHDNNRDYHELIARQVVDFLLPKLEKMGGILSLTDVFCLFNRARGTNLISPEDLRQACDLLGELHLGISQRTFPSGIVVLQLDQQFTTTGENQKKSLLELCPTTALEASHTLKLSPLLALEQLEEAERQGILCRDTTLETTRFYPNRFDEWQSSY